MPQFTCPVCRKRLSTPEGLVAGQRVLCPHCRQTLQVPAPPGRTVLAAPAVTPSPRPAPREEIEEVVPDEDPPPRKRRPPKAKEEDEEERPARRRPQRGDFRCPYCGSTYPPEVKHKVSTAGWIVFVVLLIACFPTSLLALFITEPQRVCADCGIKIGG